MASEEGAPTASTVSGGESGVPNGGSAIVSNRTGPAAIQGSAKPPSWHDEKRDKGDRKAMVAHIVELLKSRKPDATADWIRKVRPACLFNVA